MTTHADERVVIADDDLIAAVAAIVTWNRKAEFPPTQERGATAKQVAWQLGVKGARRHGNGAVKGSWSGRMSGALAVSPSLLRLARAGRLRAERPVGEYRWEFWPPEGDA